LAIRIGSVLEKHFGHLIFAVPRALIKRHAPGIRWFLFAADAYSRVRVESEIEKQSENVGAIALDSERKEPAPIVTRGDDVFRRVLAPQKFGVTKDHGGAG
jgi:hypothetical protein